MTRTVAADAGPPQLGRWRNRTTLQRPLVHAVGTEQAATDLLVVPRVNLNDENLSEIGVVIEAGHTCMSLRGARAVGARTTASALLGRLREYPRSRAELLALTKGTR